MEQPLAGRSALITGVSRRQGIGFAIAGRLASLGKGALHQLTLSLSAHLAPRGITVNTVNPGATDTG
jgi:NAD(P)-dependent dehydrogenase (short-subunit alcohol dehydrogenase family)